MASSPHDVHLFALQGQRQGAASVAPGAPDDNVPDPRVEDHPDQVAELLKAIQLPPSLAAGN